MLFMTTMPRRSFLGTTLAGAVGITPLFTRARAADASTAGPPLRVGVIGCGGYGRANLNAAFKVGGVDVVGLCDVDSAHLEQTAKLVEERQGRRPRTFKSDADLLGMSGLQAVVIASPPHWHALHFLAALEHGVDVYCEKPLAYDVREGQAMVEAARQAGRVVQIGFQRRQAEAIRQAREYLREGKAGRIIQVDANIHYQAGMRDATPQAPPSTLDWDLWCGPSPKQPYSPQIGHFAWRLEKETGHGHLVDWGIHLIDATRWILGDDAPRAVTATGGLYYFKDKITTPDILTAHFEFATCPVTWTHRIWGAAEYTPEIANGIQFYGEQETVFVTDNRWVAIPRARGQARRETTVNSDAGTAHMADFLDAVRTRRPTSCNIEDGWHSTTAVQLAMASYESGTPVIWDAARTEIRDNPAATQLLKRDYRAPWKHPYT
jgi:predicted dehydrogenase